MYPHIDIWKIADSYFNYSVSIGQSHDRHVQEGMRSITECLHDAATALSERFEIAAISYEGAALGAYHVSAMEHHTMALAVRLRDKLDAVSDAPEFEGS